MSLVLQKRSLFGDNFKVKSEVGHWLLMCRHNRAVRSWVKEGCYAWWRFTGDLEHWQRKLVVFRRSRSISVASAERGCICQE
jgi:hypothetical protein